MTAPTDPTPDTPPNQPPQHDWDETPAEAARHDRAWFNQDED